MIFLNGVEFLSSPTIQGTVSTGTGLTIPAVTFSGDNTWGVAQTGMTLTSPAINGTISTTGLTMPAFTLGGTMTAINRTIDTGSGNLATLTTTALGGLIVTGNSATHGPVTEMRFLDTTPTTATIIGGVAFRGFDGAPSPVLFRYGLFEVVSTNVTNGAEEATLKILLATGGVADQQALTLTGVGALWTDLSVDTLTYKVSGTQVVGARVVDARCDDTINSGDATTDGVIDSLRDAMITHGLVAAS